MDWALRRVTAAACICWGRLPMCWWRPSDRAASAPPAPTGWTQGCLRDRCDGQAKPSWCGRLKPPSANSSTRASLSYGSSHCNKRGLNTGPGPNLLRRRNKPRSMFYSWRCNGRLCLQPFHFQLRKWSIGQVLKREGSTKVSSCHRCLDSKEHRSHQSHDYRQIQLS